jgi:hypothetical protein
MIDQALYLAYRDIGQMEVAEWWLSNGRDRSRQNPNLIEWQWANLELKSGLTYVPFENHLVLAVEPSFTQYRNKCINC